MLEKVFIFIVFLGPLVFFHELGHFLFARFFGVRVETFSIGFGPKLLSFTKGGTRYALSLIPLGGYVKMFGDDPLSEVKLTEEEEAVAYTKKSKWARFWIVFGGPLANFILAFVLYFSLVSFGENVPEAKFGQVQETSFLYEHGVRSGDILKAINDQRISSFDDLNLVDSQVSSITVMRDKVQKNFKMDISGYNFTQKFSEVTTQLRAPILVNTAGENYLLRVQDTNDELISFEEILNTTGMIISVHKITSDLKTIKKLEDLKFDSNHALKFTSSHHTAQTLMEKGYYPRDIYISSIVASSPADKAGLRKGDILLSVNGNKVTNFGQLRENVQKSEENVPINLTILSNGSEKKIQITPLVNEVEGKKVFTIGVYSGMLGHPARMVDSKSESFIESISTAWKRTAIGIEKTVMGFKKLITGEVSLKNIGGPLAIGKVASDSFDISLSMFFRLMALISINLGIINLFPIPVLDGGHIVFIFLELINGKPLSRKKMMYAQQVGLCLLFGLIFFSLFNDFSRFF